MTKPDWNSRDLPVTPETVTVLGYAVKADNPMWAGLDWSDVILLERATVFVILLGSRAPADQHLSVAWSHPGDDKKAWQGTRYRVRPRRKGWRFVKVGDEWRLQR